MLEATLAGTVNAAPSPGSPWLGASAMVTLMLLGGAGLIAFAGVLGVYVHTRTGRRILRVFALLSPLGFGMMAWGSTLAYGWYPDRPGFVVGAILWSLLAGLNFLVLVLKLRAHGTKLSFPVSPLVTLGIATAMILLGGVRGLAPQSVLRGDGAFFIDMLFATVGLQLLSIVGLAEPPDGTWVTRTSYTVALVYGGIAFALSILFLRTFSELPPVT